MSGETKALDQVRVYAIEHPNEGMDIAKMFNERQEQLIKQSSLLNTVNGAKMEVENMISLYDGHGGNNATTGVEKKVEDTNAPKEK